MENSNPNQTDKKLTNNTKSPSPGKCPLFLGDTVLGMVLMPIT